jgi:4-hydroxy-tetrahydrodipicolinate synthase
MTHVPRLFVPAITPFRPDLSVDTAGLVAIGRMLIDDGADGLAPFGTTSEATSMSVAERMAALEAMIAGGIDPGRLIPGTGCAALPDTIALTRHAVELGVKGALMLPPFYYKPVTEEGVFAAYARVIEAIGSDRLRLYLYHIPQLTGVPITLGLIDRLIGAFPGVVTGLKDSSGKWENTAAVIAAFPQVATYSASEALLPQNVAAGGAGCISASANVNAAGIARLIRVIGTNGEAEAADQAARVRTIFEGLPLIPAIKAAVARRTGKADLAIVRPPLVALASEHDAAIATALTLCEGVLRA